MEFRIGWVCEHVDGSLVGALRTLTMRDQLELRPTGAADPATGHRDYDALIGSGARMGHATSRGEVIDVTLYSPGLAHPITAEARRSDDPQEWHLFWSVDGRPGTPELL